MTTDAMMIDCDGHILEPPDLWDNYLEPEFKSLAPSHLAGYENDPPTWVLEVHVDEIPRVPIAATVVGGRVVYAGD